MPDLEVELVLDAGAELGEAPCWDTGAQLLLWVDITAGIVHRFDPAHGGDETFDIGQPVGAAVPTESGQIALAVSNGFAILDVRTGRVERIADVDRGVSGTMMNDGKCDPAGRFWAGTRDVEGRQPLGSLYRLDADHRVTRVLSGVTLSNGLDWSPDRRTLYYVDSTTYGIDAFDFEISTGDLSGRRRFVDLPREPGDKLCVRRRRPVRSLRDIGERRPLSGGEARPARHGRPVPLTTRRPRDVRRTVRRVNLSRSRRC